MKAVASPSVPPGARPVLEARGLSKAFRGFLAVDRLDLSVGAGTIHALIGPNGAGKTTVFNLLTKVLAPTSGRILYQGVDITSLPPARVARLGMVRSFQISAVFGRMTVLDNVRVALQRMHGLSTQWWRPLGALRALDERAYALLASVRLEGHAHLLAGDLSYGRKRVLEIATTLALEPELLLLDEPLAGIGHEDIDGIASLIRAVAKGRTVLMVEHNLNVVSQLCDTITVLARGQILTQGSYAEVSSHPDVRAAYLGSAVA